MIYRKLLLQLILRISGIVLLSVFMGWLIWESSHPYWALLVVSLIAFFVFKLVQYLNFTNRMLSHFFSSVQNGDSALQIPHTGKGNSLEELRASMQKVNQIIKDLRLQYQQKEIVSDAIIENAAVGLLSYNSNGVVEFINRKGRELLGVHHLVHLKALLKVDPEIVKIFETIKAGENRVFKTTVKKRNLYLSISCTQMKLSGKELKLISFKDIKNELDATELESWQRLINVMTHEIMNSVAPITSLSKTLAKSFNQIETGAILTSKTLSKTRTGLQVIQEQGEGLMHFVETYRRLTRIPKPRIKPFSVKHLFEHLRALLCLDDDPRIIYNFSVEDDDFTIDIDESQVVQVLINLVKNAQSAIREKGWISLSAYHDLEGGACIAIEDDGEGIRDEDLKNVFVPFFTTKENGSGIGLSLARQIVRLHNGKIRLDSAYGKGTKVELFFLNYLER